MRKRPGRGRAALASGALLLGVLGSFTGQTGAAAAAQPPAATASPQPGTGAGAAGTAGPGPKAAAPKADPAAAHEAAVRSLPQGVTAGACPAALQPSTVVNCSVEPNATGSFQIALSRPDVVVLQLVSSPGIIRPKLMSPSGTTVTCEHVLGAGDYAFGAVRCPATQAGTYTVKAENGTGSQTQIWVSYLPLLSSTTCKEVAPADRRLGAPTVFQGSLPAGSAGDCYTLDLAANDVLRGYTSSKDMLQSVYDATGKQLCVTTRVWSDTEGVPLDCKLTGTAPFRVMTVRPEGASQAYDLTLARLSKPEGCVLVEPQAFGLSPDLSSTVRCRTLRASQSAWHAFGPVASAAAPSGTLFTADGAATARECAFGGCELTAGDYTWAVDPKTPAAGAYGMAFHSAKETRGCTATHDNGLVAGPVTGTFGGPGQQLCLTLPTATGKGVYLLNRTPAGGKGADAVVYDASGVKQCEYSGYLPVCKLTGTAPFRAVLTGTPSQVYGLAIHRTGEAAGCAAWPQTGFDGSVGVEAALTSDRLQACLSLPADKHSAAEMLHYSAPSNREWATFYVADAAGDVACGGSAVLTCSLTPGAPYTVMLVGQAADTHKLARRDISGTAKCPAPASTTVGGRSTPFDLTSALDARCLRVSGAATDKFWLSARTAGGKDDPSATLQVVDAGGKHLCRQYTVSCRVTGSTSYVVLVHTTGFQGKPVHADVDTWKVGTSAGWAPECTANRISVEGFPARSGVLTESSTAYCAVVDMKPSQSFAVSGQSISNDTSSYATPELSLLSGRKWEGSGSDSGYRCDGGFGSRCSAASDAEAGQAVLMLSAAKTVVPVEYTMRGSCVTTCTGQQPSPWVSGISPATGPAGTWNQAVIHGVDLTLGMELMLTPSDTPYGTGPFMRSLSVSPDGTWLKVLVDTTGLAPGQYDVSPVLGHRLAKAYTVTAAGAPAKSRFVPITPSRFLDTRDGTGATKTRVGPGGVVTLQVAGVKGVPASGVTAVVMNVTAVDPTEAGHVMVYPNGQPKPAVSNLNFAAGQIVPNLVTVPVLNGKVDLRNNAGSVDLIADVTGYYTDKADTGSALTPITPARFLDTREGTGANKARVGPGGVVTLQVAGVKGVPADGVTAVVMNVTAVNPTEAGHVTVYPNGQAAPEVSNLNFTAGQIVPNLVTVPVVNGMVDLRNNAGSVDLIADVTGYYSANGSTFSAGSPVRLLDTRDGTGARAGAVGQGGIVSLQVAGVEGVPLNGVKAVVLNVTVTGPTQDSHLIVHPHGTARPNVSNLNFRSGQTVSNLVVVPVVDGRVTFFNNAGSVDVIADLNGYFTS
ncbi:hypothetical protein OG429_17225 [Streptomyces sp. NBC_00190]|uniref:hypothetical protein n=1 Tax=unclassified Streptomyces TaxID=2593676 RepID=UPI002E28DA3F|nr:hypothetical protein [Streptomyces sp. NBC_00190]WSZ40856.1 hypothetical protein OG239_19925 [Streptomyces sp. NBC_00868]